MKVLFLIHDLGQGGAEKVLVNLVNNMDQSKFDITVMALFGGGVNEQFLHSDIKYRTIFSRNIPGNSKLMKVLSPKQLHRLFIKKHYDVEISYLEGPTARIISGYGSDRRWHLKNTMWSRKKAVPHVSTKLVSWIHVEQQTLVKASASFRSETEAKKCYNKFDRIVCVSETVKDDFCSIIHPDVPIKVLYNTVESAKIKRESEENIEGNLFSDSEINLIAVGSLKPVKGFDRLICIHKKLIEEGISVHTYILGKGPQGEELKKLTEQMNVSETVTFLGYQVNPYKYVAKSDLFICSSYAEGFSTAATEALIVGTPVCTVDVSGMKEMLGYNNEYGFVVENEDNALYLAIKRMISEPGLLEHYKRQAELRGKSFSTEKTVREVENFLLELVENYQ